MIKRKTNLRKLIDSINESDFQLFKAALEKKTKEGELAKKLYEKHIGASITKDIYSIAIKIGNDVPFLLSADVDNRILVIITTVSYDGTSTTVEKRIDINDELVLEAAHKYGKHLIYRRFDEECKTVVGTAYLQSKALRYDVDLDNETYCKLRSTIDLFNK